MSGMVLLHQSYSKEIEKMLSELRHRGTQETHFFRAGSLILGCGVRQDKDEFAVSDNKGLALDGTPYYKGRKLGAADLLQLLNTFSEKILSELQGAFALVLLEQEKVLAARDFLGRKPLYHINGSGQKTIPGFGNKSTDQPGSRGKTGMARYMLASRQRNSFSG